MQINGRAFLRCMSTRHKINVNIFSLLWKYFTLCLPIGSQSRTLKAHVGTQHGKLFKFYYSSHAFLYGAWLTVLISNDIFLMEWIIREIWICSSGSMQLCIVMLLCILKSFRSYRDFFDIYRFLSNANVSRSYQL